MTEQKLDADILQMLSETTLFHGIRKEEIRTMLECLQYTRKKYGKDETVLYAGDTTKYLGIVLKGSVNIEDNDAWGKRKILNNIAPGQIFAETYACIPGEVLMVSVTTAEPAEVLLLDAEKLMETCRKACSFHSQLIRNLLMIMAGKNLNLSRHILFTAPKTIREKLTAYLSFLAARQGKNRITVPFDRQELADYLGVDRSALSSELGKMKKDGLLDYRKNQFQLKFSR